MTASKKVLLAAVILAAGYGAAALCGRPNVTNLLGAAPAASSVPSPLVAENSPAIRFINPPPTSSYGARLVPDTATDAKPQPILRQLQQPIVNQPQETPPPLLATDTLKAEARDSIYALSIEQQTTIEPRAKLRDEAPRPLATGPRTTAVVPRVAPLAINGTTVSGFHANVVAAPSSTPASIQNSTPSIHAQPAGGISQHAGTAFPTLATSETQSTAANLTPLRLPSPTEVDEPRTHIVVDGDSLAKLAGRYLDDPRRAEEILELNRGLLSDPQLLPIGVELLIPPRSADTSMSGNSPQSYLPRTVAIHSAHGHGLVPVRPIPSGSTLTPRARLVNPRSAE